MRFGWGGCSAWVGRAWGEGNGEPGSGTQVEKEGVEGQKGSGRKGVLGVHRGYLFLAWRPDAGTEFPLILQEY